MKCVRVGFGLKALLVLCLQLLMTFVERLWLCSRVLFVGIGPVRCNVTCTSTFYSTFARRCLQWHKCAPECCVRRATLMSRTALTEIERRPNHTHGKHILLSLTFSSAVALHRCTAFMFQSWCSFLKGLLAFSCLHFYFLFVAEKSAVNKIEMNTSSFCCWTCALRHSLRVSSFERMCWTRARASSICVSVTHNFYLLPWERPRNRDGMEEKKNRVEMSYILVRMSFRAANKKYLLFCGECVRLLFDLFRGT